ncbi:DUF4389 domain-containing protein, partial [Amnibacterium sp.]|uniref:DUF4389 domain-containing protein n=1 Tax=Amnibacterium sp. TaxID=1872496 RepID=UPI0026324941
LARTDYPADFDVEYPERLSRGLVLVKSWLLAIPHLVVVFLIVSDLLVYPWADAAVGAGAAASPVGGYSILNLVVVIAGAFLLITGVYPQPLFDFVVGVNRWLYRVVTYVALMRDEYPPFRLDMGATEPLALQAAQGEEAAPMGVATPASGRTGNGSSVAFVREG